MISILLLCWNHSRFLEQCIASLSAQSVPANEIVFLDNCSTDGSFEIATSLFERYGIKARMLRNSSPEGISKNFNRLTDEATGSLIAPLSTDDWYAPNYVSEMTKAARSFPETDWFYPAGWTFAQDTGEIRLMPTENFRSGDVHEWVRRLQWPFGWVGCCYRKEVIVELGGWDESLPVEDVDMMFRLGMAKTCQYVAAPLIYYRQTMGSVSTNLLLCATALDGFFRKHHGQIEQPDVKHSETLRAYSALAIDRGHLPEAATLLGRAIRLAPLRADNMRTLWYLVRTAANRHIRRAR